MLRAKTLTQDKSDRASFARDDVCSHARTDLDDMESCSDDREEVSMPAETGDGDPSPVGGNLMICTAFLGYVALLQLLSVLFVCFSHGCLATCQSHAGIVLISVSPTWFQVTSLWIYNVE